MPDFDVDKILDDIDTRLAVGYEKAVADYLVAFVMKNAPQARAARLRLEEVIRESMGKAEILGALSTLRRASTALSATFNADRGALLVFGQTAAEKILHRVTFEESVVDLLTRVPVTVRPAAERTAQRIAELYGQGRVVAFAKSAEDAVTKRARELITQAVREGIPEVEVGKSLRFGVERVRADSAAWSESYARMAFRTNLNTAVTAGRFRQAQDPDIRVAVPAFRFTAVGDADTRDNHAGADGVILKVDNPAWRFLAPPLGYNCRCQVDHLSRAELRRMGRLDRTGEVVESKIPSSARPDSGFRHGGRPDLSLGAR